MKLSNRPGLWLPPKSAFAGYRFPLEVIVVAVRWYLRYNLSYRDVEELLIERGIEVDHVPLRAFPWLRTHVGHYGVQPQIRTHRPKDARTGTFAILP